MKNFLVMILIFSSIGLISQDFVINAYKDSGEGNANGEWTELLVLKDGADLSGYHLIDNSDNGSWQGGITFKAASSLWKNLREGTIIVVNHRFLPQVLNREDGYIEISTTNSQHFDRYYGEVEPSDWIERALNINRLTDIIQLRKPEGIAEHSMGHSQSTYPAFNAINSPKIGYNGLMSTNSAIIANPGASQSDYDSGSLTLAALVNSGQTIKGIANSATNSDFIRSLRQPEWSNPQLTIDVDSDYIKLNWNSAAIDIDNTQGYLVLRSLKGEMEMPVDGVMYSQNSTISGAVVIALLTSNINTYKHPIEQLNCGHDYEYAVVAYRYGKDNQGKDSEPSNGRGRSYNTSEYASIQFPLEIPTMPIVEDVVDGKIIRCNSSVDGKRVSIDNPSEKYKYQWYEGDQNNPIKGQNTTELSITKPGIYLASAENEFGCIEFSERFEFVLTGEDAIELFFDRSPLFEIESDTILYLCPNETIDLRVSADGNIVWYFNDLPINTSAKQGVGLPGKYYAVSDLSGCRDTTPIVTIETLEVDLTVEDPIFELGSFSGIATANSLIQNNSKRSVEITESDFLDIPEGVIFTPAFPWLIPAKESLEFSISYLPEETGPFSEDIVLDLGCGDILSITLNGNWIEGSLSAEPIAIDTIVFNCDMTESPEFTIDIRNNSSSAVEFLPNFGERILTDPSIGTYYHTGLPSELSPGATESFTVTFSISQGGIYKTILKIPFRNDGSMIWDTLTVPLNIDYRLIDIISTEKIIIEDIGECVKTVAFDINFTNLGSHFANIIPIIDDERIKVSNWSELEVQQSYYELNVLISDPKTELIELKFYNPDCDDTLSIPVELTKLGFEYAYSQDNDLGTVYLCADDSYSHEFMLEIGGSGNDPITIKDISLPDDSEISIEIGDSFVFGENYFTVDFNSLAEGTYSGSIEIIVDPCDRVLKYDYQFIIETYDFVLEKSQILFEEVSLGKSKQTIFEITNPNSIARVIEVDYSTILPNELEIISDKGNFPITLLANESTNVTVTYKPQLHEEKGNILVDFISTGDNCAIANEVEITYSSKSKDLVILEVSPLELLPLGGNELLIGTRALIPIQFTTDQLGSFTESNTSKVILLFDVDRTMFDIISLDIIQQEVFSDGSIFFTPEEQMRIELDVNNLSVLQQGIVLNVEVLLMFGKSATSIMKIDPENSLAISNTIDLEFIGQARRIELDTICDFSYRSVSYYKDYEVMIANNLSFDDNTYLIIDSEDEKVIHISINSLEGRVALDQEIRVRQGKNILSLSEYLPAGHYFVLISDGIETKIIKVVIIS